MSNDDEMHWTIREFRECIVDSSYLETYIAGLAEKRKVKVPFHTTIEGLNVVFRLKPSNWRLRDFSRYMDFLLLCCYEEFGSLKAINPLVWMINSSNTHHFCLDKNLNATDIEFLLRNHVDIKFNRILPQDFTGESVIKGQLSEFLTLENYIKAAEFIESYREHFEIYIKWVYIFLSKAKLGEFVASKFKFFFDDDFCIKMTGFVYPLLPSASGPLPYHLNPDYISLESFSRTMINSKSNPMLRRLNKVKATNFIKKERRNKRKPS